MAKWDGKCFFSLTSTIRMPLYTLYLYTDAHNSSLMDTMSPYLERHSLLECCFTSGGSPATLIILVPLPACSMRTSDISPLSCLNSRSPFVPCRTSFIRSSLVNFMYTLRRGPSTKMALISSSACRML